MNTQCVSQYCWTSFNVFSIGCQHDPVCSKAITDIGNFTKSAIRYVCRVDSGGVLTWAPSSWQTSGPRQTRRPTYYTPMRNSIPNGGQRQRRPSSPVNNNRPPLNTKAPTQQPVLMRGNSLPSGIGGGGNNQPQGPRPTQDTNHPPLSPQYAPTARPTFPLIQTWGSPGNSPVVGPGKKTHGQAKASGGGGGSGVWIGILIACFVVAGGVFWYLRSKDLRATFGYDEFDDLLSNNNGITDDHL